MVDLYFATNFLGIENNGTLLAQLRALAGAAAPVYGVTSGGAVDSNVRRVTKLPVSTEIRDLVKNRLMEFKDTLATHFGIPLNTCEEPQFLRYTEGGFFVAHQDGNTPIIRDDSRFRKVSVVLFLNAQSESESPVTYGGGELVFHGPFTTVYRRPVAPEAGTLVAFRAETTHEVRPVIHGERYTIVTWFR